MMGILSSYIYLIIRVWGRVDGYFEIKIFKRSETLTRGRLIFSPFRPLAEYNGEGLRLAGPTYLPFLFLGLYQQAN